MAALQTPGDVKNVTFQDIKALDRVVGIWTLTLRSSSDTLVVPGLNDTDGVGSLTTGITVSAGALTEGQNTLTITGGSLGTEAVVTTLHRQGFLNNLSRDEDPT